MYPEIHENRLVLNCLVVVFTEWVTLDSEEIPSFRIKPMLAGRQQAATRPSPVSRASCQAWRRLPPCWPA